ncbi:hypothetical protein A8F53_34620, partial [Burkholderia cenocepacia]
GSLHKAAEEIAISQPGATKVLREIEDILGMPLFERQPKGLVANDLGRCVTPLRAPHLQRPRTPAHRSPRAHAGAWRPSRGRRHHGRGAAAHARADRPAPPPAEPVGRDRRRHQREPARADRRRPHRPRDLPQRQQPPPGSV